MGFFRFAYRQSNKGLGRTFLFALLLAFIFSLSVVVMLLKGIYDIKHDDRFTDFNKDLNCEIINYELTCDQDYFREDNFVIDLTYDDETELNEESLILTKNRVVTPDGSLTYKDLLSIIGHDESRFTAEDLQELIGQLSVVIVIVVFLTVFVVMYCWYLLSNIVLALIMKVLVNANTENKFSFERMYKLTMIAVLPYVLFNAICRMIFGGVLTGYLSELLPTGDLITRILLDYVIIFGLISLAIRENEIKELSNNTTPEDHQ